MKRKIRQISSENAVKHKRSKFTLQEVKLDRTTAQGVLFVTGTGDVGQLGLGPDVIEKKHPALVDIKEEIVDICAGGMHTVCLTVDGKVLTFGCNDEGALGRVTEEEEQEFQASVVDLAAKVVQISAGDSHTAALLDDGRVFAWGTFRDSHGNMGMTTRGNEKLPFEIFAEHPVVKIASGADHLVFLTNEGDVFTCGCAEQGQLGRTTERSSGRNARSGIGKGSIEKLLQPLPISLKPSLKLHFDNIWAASYGTFCQAAKSDDIYVFGLNNYNQMGLPSMAPQYIPKRSPEFSKYKWSVITSGQHHSVALSTDGIVYVIGRKEYGRLGLGKGCEDATELTPVKSLESKIVNVACGSATSFAVTEKGELFGWGMGTNGQLGTGDEEDCELPTLAKSKKLQGHKVVRVSSGGQHTVILAVPNERKEDN